MSFNEWLLFIHVVAAVIWVGGSVMVQVFGFLATRNGDPDRALTFANDAAWVGNRIFTASALVVLGAGIWMVVRIDAWGFDQFWISFAFAVIIASAILGGAFYGPQSGRLRAVAAERGAADPEVGRLIRRIVVVSQIETVALIVVIYMMVFKPGA